MLKQRILTALVLIPLVVSAILGLPTPYLALVLAALTLLGAWEWTRLMAVDATAWRVGYVVAIAILMGMSWRFGANVLAQQLIFSIALAWWLVALVRVLTYRGATVADTSRHKALDAGAGFLILVPAWLALVRIHGGGDSGPYFLFFLLLLIWVADSGAYFAGRQWGRTKLAPHVSPGKSWEGVIGALLAVVLYAGSVGWWLDYSLEKLALFLLLGTFTAAISIVGDLLESLHKRQRGVKDSGTLLPGHGGVLDRIDSLTSAAPCFVLGLHWLEQVA